jgi:uncharacterized membrane protein YqaE (UPF0057 family)
VESAGKSPSSDLQIIMHFFLCIFLPPLAVLLTGRKGSFILSLFLTLFGWLPGVIHAFFVVSDHRNEKRIRAIADELRR